MRLKSFFVMLALATSLPLVAQDYAGHQLDSNVLQIRTDAPDNTSVRIRALNAHAFEVHYSAEGVRQLPSYALKEGLQASAVELQERDDRLIVDAGAIRAEIRKAPLQIAFYRGDELLLREEAGFFAHDTMRGFRFALSPGEKLLGGGERVMGMDRRGQRMPLYNRAHYGYETESEQMYFSLPAVMSDRKYLLLFDNSASGHLDIGKTEADVLQFEAVAGRTGYVVVAGENYPDLIGNYTAVTGAQPLPPRWALGNFASRFGYRSEKEVREVVAKFREEDFPLDAVVLDIFWFGPDIKGHMGTLDWDRNAFPNAEQMIADFQADGINTILVTEPFILTSSKRWDDAVAADVLAKDLAGRPKTFDFYFGNTGLVDVFDEKAADWFWNINKGLLEQGVAGIWGDLGEPEVHPSDTIHAVGPADAVHNAYGHKWAQLLYENHEREFAEQRPFIMMRAGFPGSQRFGMIPWTGDVNRTWGGLKPQVELALQMGLMGFGYIHSDLGGFAGGEKFDRELYIRWLQYGVFQPVYRPHAQEHIAPEPVLHDRKTRNILREYVKLRYRLLPYNYTLAYQNAVSGMPLMRPLFFEDESLFDYTDAYLWGDAFLVAPVKESGLRRVPVRLPAGAWFDFWSGERYEGDREISVRVKLDTIPVLVRAGSLVPMVDAVRTTRDYSTEKLQLHYWADESMTESSAELFDDDGRTHKSIDKGEFELLTFGADRKGAALTLSMKKSGKGFSGAPQQREISVTVHNWPQVPGAVQLEGEPVEFEYDRKLRTLTFTVQWQGGAQDIKISPAE
ncbi:TIM-barrel domain-containing protein [Biformimicrobium ophioploci]|uniref:Glycoside hydrolase family 31 protein n=1 Tax=Biformimicrobium ophioploci TaxID=3036711 RepID=A0ABQ6M133_9GAMM|nr:TIM-barrel domain-containing protein [Microbulbifer sp. NKW57]GMG88049.1 glycoside hydrolase family 31 protein [Microbulbifer sp. NKW57]